MSECEIGVAFYDTRARIASRVARSHLNLWLSLPRRDSALFMDLNMTAQRRAEPLRARHAQPTPGPSLRDRAMKNCAVGVGRPQFYPFATGAVGGDTSQT